MSAVNDITPAALEAWYRGPTVPENFAAFSEEFWQDHQDLLIGGIGVVAMVGITSEQEVVRVEDPHDHVQSVTLDARQANAGEFLWQLSVTNPRGRTVEDLAVGENPFHRILSLDTQGRVRHHEGTLSRNNRASEQQIMDLIAHPLVADTIVELHAKRAIALEDAATYKTKNPDLFPSLLEKRLKEKEANAAKIGFAPLAPQIL